MKQIIVKYHGCVFLALRRFRTYTLSTFVGYRRQSRERRKNIERYTFIKTLSTHRFSTVWLAKSRSLGAERIVKGIAKHTPYHDLLIREARILKNLDHPAVPKVIDIEEDEQFTYIIEQYVEGESLGELLKHRLLSERELFSVLDRIGSVLIHLHSQTPPIVYLDLKPENIIMRKAGAFLIDFGSAGYEKERAVFSNPTFYKKRDGEHEASCLDDVYAFGKLAIYLTERSLADARTAGRIGKAAAKCCRARSLGGISSVKTFVRMVKNISGIVGPDENGGIGTKTPGNKELKASGKRKLTGKRIGVLGLSRGDGATTVALALSNYLGGEKRMSTVCREASGRKDIAMFARELPGGEKGSSSYNHVTYYGARTDGVCAGVLARSFECTVTDLGTDRREALKEFEQCDIRIIVGSCAPWRRDEYVFLERLLDRICEGKGKGAAGRGRKRVPEGWFLIVSPAEEKNIAGRMKTGIPVFAFPFIPDVLRPGKEACRVFSRIMNTR